MAYFEMTKEDKFVAVQVTYDRYKNSTAPKYDAANLNFDNLPEGVRCSPAAKELSVTTTDGRILTTRVSYPSEALQMVVNALNEGDYNKPYEDTTHAAKAKAKAAAVALFMSMPLSGSEAIARRIIGEARWVRLGEVFSDFISRQISLGYEPNDLRITLVHQYRSHIEVLNQLTGDSFSESLPFIQKEIDKATYDSVLSACVEQGVRIHHQLEEITEYCKSVEASSEDHYDEEEGSYYRYVSIWKAYELTAIPAFLQDVATRMGYLSAGSVIIEGYCGYASVTERLVV